MRTTFGPERAHGITSEAMWREQHLRAVRHLGVRPWRYIGPVPYAYVNHARWVIDCPNCHSGVTVSVTWRLGLCYGCGAIYDPVSVPHVAERQAVEALFVGRPEVNRNWHPRDESALDIEVENVAHNAPDLPAARKRMRDLLKSRRPERSR